MCLCVSATASSEKLESLKPVIRGFSTNIGLDKVNFEAVFLRA